MSDLRKAAEMALEALRYTCDHLPAKTGVEREVDDAITALQIALVKPEWVGLSYDQIEILAEQVGMCIDKYGLALDAETGLKNGVDAYGFARAIEAELKEKNI